MMVYRRVIDANTALVAVWGRMMGGPGHERLHKTVKRLAERGSRWIVIDLGRVDWMNSSGLGDLMGCLTTVRRSGGDIVVARATRKVRSLFMIMKVMEIFDTRDSVRAALVRLRELRAARQRVSENGAWPEVTSGPEDWAFVQERLKAERDADVAHEGLAERADTRERGRFRYGKRFGRPIRGAANELRRYYGLFEQKFLIRQRLRTILLALAAAWALWTFVIGDAGVFRLLHVKHQNARLAPEIEALAREEEDLLREVRLLEQADPATLEHVAREQHALVKDGEVLVRFYDAEAEAEE